MDRKVDDSSEIQARLDRLRQGDQAAREELLVIACARLAKLARKMLKGYPGVERWEQTDDVLQNAMLRLHRALMVTTPDSPRSFFNLAAVQIRRELIDLCRHYFGPWGLATHHDSQVLRLGRDSGDALDTLVDTRPESSTLGTWTEFHTQIDALPEEQREVFNLLWYQGLSQAQAAELLGVTERVVKYRWRSARLRIHELLDGRMPV